MQELKAEGLWKSFLSGSQKISVLRDVNLNALPGDTLAIVGPSGSGKSTLLYILGSLEKPDEGSIYFGGKDVLNLKGDLISDYRAKDVGFIFQDHHLLPQLTAIENVLLPTMAIHSSQSVNKAATDLMKRVGLEARMHAFPAQMSGGERQRVAIARALMNGASMLLCDEPAGNLDQDTGREVVDLLLELAKEQQTIVIMVTHNLEHASKFTRQMNLHEGSLLEQAQ
jgi:lipoprotein-releasing system ATP-binding protein